MVITVRQADNPPSHAYWWPLLTGFPFQCRASLWSAKQLKNEQYHYIILHASISVNTGVQSAPLIYCMWLSLCALAWVHADCAELIACLKRWLLLCNVSSERATGNRAYEIQPELEPPFMIAHRLVVGSFTFWELYLVGILSTQLALRIYTEQHKIGIIHLKHFAKKYSE